LQRDRENAKAVKARNVQKVLQQGYVKILCQLSWKFPVCTY